MTWWLTTIYNEIWHSLQGFLKTATVYLHIIINLKKNRKKNSLAICHLSSLWFIIYAYIVWVTFVPSTIRKALRRSQLGWWQREVVRGLLTFQGTRNQRMGRNQDMAMIHKAHIPVISFPYIPPLIKMPLYPQISSSAGDQISRHVSLYEEHWVFQSNCRGCGWQMKDFSGVCVCVYAHTCVHIHIYAPECMFTKVRGGWVFCFIILYHFSLR